MIHLKSRQYIWQYNLLFIQQMEHCLAQISVRLGHLTGVTVLKMLRSVELLNTAWKKSGQFQLNPHNW